MGRETRSRWLLVAVLLLLLIGGGAWLLPQLLRSQREAALAGPGRPSEVESPPSFVAATPESASTALVAPPSATTASRSTSLRVFVTWERDGTPAGNVGLSLSFWAAIPGAGLRTQNVLTDGRGEWFGAEVPPGRVSVSFDRYSNGASTTLAPGEAGEMHVAIPAGVLVRGLVTDATGTPEPGAQILIGSTTTEESAHVVGTSGPDGRFELRDFARSSHTVGARSARHGPSCMQAIWAKEGDVVDVVLVLNGDCASIHGLVLSPDGAPVGGAQVNIGGSFGFGPLPKHDPTLDLRLPPPFDLVTAPDGSFLAEGVPAPRSVAIVASAEGFSPAVAIAPLDSGQVAEVTLTLSKPVRVSGTVRDGDGRPVEGALVLAGPPNPYDRGSPEPDRSRPLGSYRFTGPDGRFEFSGLLSGKCKLLASKDDAGRDAQVLQLAPGQELTWDPVLAAGASIAGRLLDAQGAPAPYWTLAAIPQPGRGEARRVRSRADGQFEIRNVAKGPQQIRATGRDLGNAEVILADGIESGTKDLLLHLPAGTDRAGRITGRVVDVTGKPPARARITLASEAQPGYPASFDATSGQFTAEALPPGTWRVTVADSDAPTQDFGPFVLTTGAFDVGTLMLQAGGTWALTLRAPAGAAVGQALVRKLSGPGWAPIDRDGDTWRSQPLVPGTYVLQVETHDFLRLQRELVVEAGRETAVSVDLVGGVRQELDLYVASALSAEEEVPLSIVVRSLAGDVAWDMVGGHLPAWSGPPQPADQVTMKLDCVIAPGNYLVDLDAGSKSVHGLQLGAAAQTPWELRLP